MESLDLIGLLAAAAAAVGPARSWSTANSTSYSSSSCCSSWGSMSQKWLLGLLSDLRSEEDGKKEGVGCVVMAK